MGGRKGEASSLYTSGENQNETPAPFNNKEQIVETTNPRPEVVKKIPVAEKECRFVKVLVRMSTIQGIYEIKNEGSIPSSWILSQALRAFCDEFNISEPPKNSESLGTMLHVPTGKQLDLELELGSHVHEGDLLMVLLLSPEESLEEKQDLIKLLPETTSDPPVLKALKTLSTSSIEAICTQTGVDRLDALYLQNQVCHITARFGSQIALLSDQKISSTSPPPDSILKSPLDAFTTVVEYKFKSTTATDFLKVFKSIEFTRTVMDFQNCTDTVVSSWFTLLNGSCFRTKSYCREIEDYSTEQQRTSRINLLEQYQVLETSSSLSSSVLVSSRQVNLDVSYGNYYTIETRLFVKDKDDIGSILSASTAVHFTKPTVFKNAIITDCLEQVKDDVDCMLIALTKTLNATLENQDSHEEQQSHSFSF